MLRGFGPWRRRPGLMLLGMVPALLVLAVQVSLVVPVGAVLVMPAAVAGATMLARDLVATAVQTRV
ncbi:hypothetical protein NPS01_15350 [Nocardioides psychrotolerans]|nr:hypothetical protein [Nocardioides psychrotolerans]GEP37872.1 hypothetical protein NPS01_15350 [Nocardioides psychrotolerans]